MICFKSCQYQVLITELMIHSLIDSLPEDFRHLVINVMQLKSFLSKKKSRAKNVSIIPTKKVRRIISNGRCSGFENAIFPASGHSINQTRQISDCPICTEAFNLNVYCQSLVLYFYKYQRDGREEFFIIVIKFARDLWIMIYGNMLTVNVNSWILDSKLVLEFLGYRYLFHYSMNCITPF